MFTSALAFSIHPVCVGCLAASRHANVRGLYADSLEKIDDEKR